MFPLVLDVFGSAAASFGLKLRRKQQCNAACSKRNNALAVEAEGETLMKMIQLVIAVALLFAATEASAQKAGTGNTNCPNAGYRGNVWCCNVNNDLCHQRAKNAAGRFGGNNSPTTSKDR